MIYPKKIEAKKTDKIIRILIILSIFIAIVLWLINKYTTPNVPWAALTNGGILYIWVTVWYSIKKNINIAGHVLVQGIAISLLTMYIDYQLGFRAWSIDLAIPIIIMIANITMLVLTIISYKKYFKYAIYQLIILLFSMLPIIFITENITHNKTLCVVATVISIINLMITLILSSKDLKEAIVRKFHM